MKGLRNLVPIAADASGNAPSEIELLRTGNWHTPWHGDFELTTEDLEQFVANFTSGVGLVVGDKEAPINFGHFMSGEAAGWISSLEVRDDGQALIGHVQWIDEAREAIKAKKWKYISPEFNPRSWPWEDSEEEHHFVNNVLTGAALTNIPLFKKLKPITASRLASPGVKADQTKPNEEGESMNLAEILAKAVADRTDEEKAFLEEHKAELTEEQQAQLDGEVETPETPEEPETPETPAEGGAPVAASAIKGITEAELTQLRADAQAGRAAMAKLEKKEASDFVATHIAAGRIKSDQKDNTVQMILASKGDERTKLESFISSLPVNALLADESGHGGDADEDKPVELTDEEKKLAKAFNNTDEDLAEFKKKESN